MPLWVRKERSPFSPLTRAAPPMAQPVVPQPSSSGAAISENRIAGTFLSDQSSSSGISWGKNPQIKPYPIVPQQSERNNRNCVNIWGGAAGDTWRESCCEGRVRAAGPAAEPPQRTKFAETVQRTVWPAARNRPLAGSRGEVPPPPAGPLHFSQIVQESVK